MSRFRLFPFTLHQKIGYNKNMENKASQTIEKHALLASCERVLIALSGGADSVALLHVLKALGYDVYAAHINHMIRGDEALRDEWFCVDLCRELGVPLMVYKKNCPQYAHMHKLTTEEAARKLRYEALENALQTFECQKIATAHTQNDNLETMLMRLIRGTSSYGLRGIDIKRGHIIRPLLEMSRTEIESYVKKHSLNYMEDSTNKDTAYLRNRVRHMLLPELESSYNPNIRGQLSKLSDSLKTDADYFGQEVRAAFDKFVTVFKGDTAIISKEAAKTLHPAILERLIRHCVTIISGDDKDFDHIHTMIARSLFDKPSGKKVNLTKGLAAANSFDDVALYKEVPPITGETALSLDEFIQIGNTEDFISFSSSPPNLKENFINTCTHVFICDKMVDNVIVRARKDGDVIKKPCGKMIKLKDFLIERRIPAFMRDNIYVVAHNDVAIMVCSPVEYAAPTDISSGSFKNYINLWRKNGYKN